MLNLSEAIKMTPEQQRRREITKFKRKQEQKSKGATAKDDGGNSKLTGF